MSYPTGGPGYGRALSVALAVASAAWFAWGIPPRAQTAGAASQLQDNMPRSWYRNYDYGIEVDGRLDPEVGLYQLVGKRYMLIYGPGMSEAYVLNLEPKMVRPVSGSEVTAKSELEVVLAEASFSEAEPVPWMPDGATAVMFYAKDRKYRVARVPPIIGETSAEEIFQHNPMYKRGMEEYSPETEAVASLRSVHEQAQIEVWFGSWCVHCGKVVPRFLKTMQAAANPNLRVLLHAVPRNFGKYEPAVKRRVQGVPTIVFLKDGREFARIRGGPRNGSSLEEEVARILTSGTASGL